MNASFLDDTDQTNVTPDELKIIALKKKLAAAEAELAETVFILDAVNAALSGDDVSDFAESFPSVQRAQGVYSLAINASKEE